LNELVPFSPFDSFFNILILVTIISLVAWKLRFPPTIAFIIGGIASTLYVRLELPILSPEIFVTLLLPPILFQEALHLEIDGFIEEADSIFTFAILGTLLMQATIALTVWWLLEFSPLEALLFGILIAPTDPVSVIRVFQSLGVKRKFRIIVSGESLFNDGIAIVIYSTLVTVATLGAITLSDIGLLFVTTIAGGIIIGLASGYLTHTIFSWTDDKFTEVLVSFIAAFGVYRFAEELHVSGVIAIVVSGLIINYRTRAYGGFSKDSYEMLNALWEFIAYLTSSIAFIFIGTNLDQGVFYSNILGSLLLLVLLIFLRVFMVEIVCSLLEKTRKKSFPDGWRGGFVWSGLRGAVSIVLVLGVSGLVGFGDLMVALTFGIVILSNVVQGLSMGVVIRSQKLVEDRVSEDMLIHGVQISAHYDPEGYQFNRSVAEKLFFNAPEFFINETRFGLWTSRKIIFFLGFMNRYLVATMNVTTKGIIHYLVKSTVNLLSNILHIINHYLLRKKIEEKKS
jgi:CPA1 family monovalent cation:H+ antiporter